MRGDPVGDGPCTLCAHPFDDHLVVATFYVALHDGQEEIPAGGFMQCPQDMCPCFRTWSIRQGSGLWPDEVEAAIKAGLDALAGMSDHYVAAMRAAGFDLPEGAEEAT